MEKGLYIHIPFCNNICGYCDFARGLYQKDLADEYLEKLLEEIKTKDLKAIKTIYIGGGTPTALSLGQLEKLLKALLPYQDNVIEFTVEANPESLSLDKALLFKQYGVNRISMGMQVTQKALLNLIERKHNFDDVKDKVSMLNNIGINNISVDLMYGIPTQTLADLMESLEKLVLLDIKHVSLYALTIEPDSKFGLKGYKQAEADLDADMYESAIAFLEANGFYRYEISNFAKKGYQSAHNKIYWHYKDFVGVGLNASGKEAHIRYTNTRDLNNYLTGEKLLEKIVLSREDEMFEYIMMNLRLKTGFKMADFNQRFDQDFESFYKSALDSLMADKLIEINEGTIKASTYGLEILHNVIEKFMDKE